SANIACGGHASDPETMYATLQLAARNGVTVGAHPGYNDREGFGRRIIPMPPAEVGRMIAAQVGSLQALAAMAGTRVQYVKPHGALANLAADDRAVADAIIAAVRVISPDLAILAISGTELEIAARMVGIPVYSEIFADRGYLSSGRLVPRSRPGAMIHDPAVAVARLLAFVETGLMPVVAGDAIPLAAQSICIHGDSPGAVEMARQIKTRLGAAGVAIRAFLPA
ncbi:MAG: 5-oxoprolinase subunit PxpA, partial [Paracoccaceae bacterium]